MKLYELTENYNALRDLMESGEEGLDEAFEELTDAIEEKVENISCIVKEEYAQAEALKAEAKTLLERAKVHENAGDRGKAYILAQMETAEIRKIERPRACVSLRRTTSVQVDEENFVKWAEANSREDLCTIKVSPFKSEIKRNIEAGNYIPYAEIVEKNSAILK